MVGFREVGHHSGESPRHALDRELHEELGLTVRRASPWLVQEFVYPHAHVELNFFRVFEWHGEPASHDGQAFAWQVPGRYTVGPLLPANTRILRALELPLVYGITCAEDSNEDAFLARAERAVGRAMCPVIRGRMVVRRRQRLNPFAGHHSDAMKPAGLGDAPRPTVQPQAVRDEHVRLVDRREQPGELEFRRLRVDRG